MPTQNKIECVQIAESKSDGIHSWTHGLNYTKDSLPENEEFAGISY